MSFAVTRLREYPARKVCQVLQVPRSSYYAMRRDGARRAAYKAEQSRAVYNAFVEHHGSCLASVCAHRTAQSFRASAHAGVRCSSEWRRIGTALSGGFRQLNSCLFQQPHIGGSRLPLPHHGVILLAGSLVQALALDSKAFPFIEPDRPGVLLIGIQV